MTRKRFILGSTGVNWFVVGLCCVCLVIGVAGRLMLAKAKADAYERATGKRVSVIDAMFLDLRVQDEAKP